MCAGPMECRIANGMWAGQWNVCWANGMGARQWNGGQAMECGSIIVGSEWNLGWVLLSWVIWHSAKQQRVNNPQKPLAPTYNLVCGYFMQENVSR